MVIAGTALLGISASQSASAQFPGPGIGLSSYGAINPTDGFPNYYADGNGLRLKLCQDPLLCFYVVPNPAAPVVFPTNYPDEQFYFGVTGVMNGARGARVIYGQSLQAGFVTGVAQAGQQQVFSRFRIRITGLTTGAVYTITHPYGVVSYTAGTDPALPGGILEVVDIGAGVANGFQISLNGNVGPFLTPAGYVQGPPGSYISDPAFTTLIQGSPFGTNFLRIEGPGIGIAFPGNAINANAIQLNDFTLQGQVATQSGLNVSNAYVSNDATSTSVSVWATALPGSNLSAQVAGALPIRLAEIAGSGEYFGRIALPAGAAPSAVVFTNNTDFPPSTVTKTGLTDQVHGQSAVYMVGNDLYVTAATTMEAASPILTVSGTGFAPKALVPTAPGIASAALGLAPGAAPPKSVVVTSTAGGTDTIPVTVKVPTPVVANAGPAQNVAAGAAVTLSAAASTGPVVSYVWSQTAGPVVALTGANTASASFTAPNSLTASVLTFSVTVTGSFSQSSTASVNVNVAAVPPVVANAGLAQNVAAGAIVNLSAAASTGPISSYSWTQTAGPAVALIGGTTAAASFTAPNPLAATLLSFSLTVNGAFGQTSTSTVAVNVAAVPAVVANAGLDQLVAAGALVSLSGAASSGPIAGYAWSSSDPTIVITGANTAAASFTAPSLPTSSILTLTLTVTGAFGQTSTDTAIVAVSAVVAPPTTTLVANAGLDQSVAAGALVSLSGAGSTGTIVSYAWTQTAGPIVALTGANTATPSFTAPSDIVASSITLQLTVTDNLAATASDIVVINVAAVPPQPPVTPLVANAGLDQNVAAGALVSLNAAASTGAIASYAWTQTAGPIVVLTGANTANASFTAPSAATASSITLQLTITDSLAATSTDIVVINVAAVPPPVIPVVANAGIDQNVAAGARVTVNGLASTGPVASYSWAQTGGPVVALTGAATSTVSFLAPSATTASVITLTLTVRDAAGATSTDVVVINVAAAVILDTMTITVAEYIVGDNSWRVQGTARLRSRQTISVYLGAVGNTARLIGTAVVAPDGRWIIQTPLRSGPIPTATETTIWSASSLPHTPASRTFIRG